MPSAWLAGLVAILAACGGGWSEVGPTPEPVSSEATDPDATGSTASEPAEPDWSGIGACDRLHQVVLAHLDALAAVSARIDPGATVDELVEDGLMADQTPADLGRLLGMYPAAPYGGIAPDGAVDRYETLGCAPEDEYPALLGWLGLDADLDPSVADARLEAAVVERFEDLGRGGWLPLAVGRRLVDGPPMDDSPIFAALQAAVAAQMEYREVHGEFAADVAELAGFGLDPAIANWSVEAPDVPLILVSAANDVDVCMNGEGTVVETPDLVPRVREPGSASCPNSFPHLDECYRASEDEDGPSAEDCSRGSWPG